MMLTLVWDVDDVLNDLMYQWFRYGWLMEHPACPISYEGLTSNPPHLVLGVERAEYLQSMDRFRRTQHAANMSPNPEVFAWFRSDGHRFRHIALTARPLETAGEVAQWVMGHFGPWIRCFGVVPSRAAEDVPVYSQTKGEFLAWIGCGDVLIDDSRDNIIQARSLGLRAFQPAQPWNDSTLTIAAVLHQLSELAGES